jgi:beta-lactamase class A
MSDQLAHELAALAAGFSGRAGISAIHLGSGETLSVLADELFPTASAIKLFVLYELQLRAARGELDLDQRVPLEESDRVLGSGVLAHLRAGLEPTIGDLGLLMMMVSDNTAANLLIERLGPTAINASIRAAGLSRTQLRGRVDFAALARDKCALGVSTPRELASFIARLRRGELLALDAADRFFDRLRIQKYIEPLRRLLPADPYAREFGDSEAVWVASKTGSLSGVRCECGLVHAPAAEWAIAVMSQDGKDPRVTSDNEGVRLIAEVSRLVFEAWGR